MSTKTPGCFTAFKPFFQSVRHATLPSRTTDTVTRAQSPNNGTTRSYCNCCCNFSIGEVVRSGSITCINKDVPPPPYTTGKTEHYFLDTKTPVDIMENESGIVETINKTISGLDNELKRLNREIHANPELGFKEYHAKEVLTDFMEKNGFAVTRDLNVPDLETAWKAEWSLGNGGRTLGINAEMDALPEIGHACGHNLIAVGSVVIAIAAKAAMEKHGIPGTIRILGTPAEEGGGGKIRLLEKGFYDGMHLCVMSHPSPGPTNSTAAGSSLATQPFEATFTGHPAHAAASPWEGVNALDAAVTAYSSIGLLRQQIKPDCRVHAIIIVKEGSAVNIIPELATLKCIVRAPTKTELDSLLERVERSIRGAGEATSCEVEIKKDKYPYHDLRQNSVLANAYFEYAVNYYEMAVGSDPDNKNISASTDFGNVTYKLPGLHPSYAIPTENGGGNHTREFTKAAISDKAYDAALRVSKSLALLGLRCLKDDEFYDKVLTSYNNTDFNGPR